MGGRLLLLSTALAGLLICQPASSEEIDDETRNAARALAHRSALMLESTSMGGAMLVYLLVIVAGAVVVGARLAGRRPAPSWSTRISWSLLYVALVAFLFFVLRLWFRYRIGDGA